MTYFNINASAFKDVPSVSALLSLAEMLYSKSPEISSLFVNYASKLVQNQLARTGSTPDRDAAFNALQGQAAQLKLPSPKTVETFANSLVASASGQYANEFYQIAYLSYASLSIYGPLTKQIQTRITNVQNKLGIQNQGGGISAGGPPAFNPNAQGGPPAFTPAGGPPAFTPPSQGPPAFTPQGGPPQFNPASSGGPPVFTPQGSNPSFNQSTHGGPPVFTPQGGPPQFNPTSSGGPPQFNPTSSGGPPQFNPTSSGGPPVFTPQGSNPSFNQSTHGGPPVFTPQGGQPSFNPNSSGGPPAFTPPTYGGPPAFNPSSGSGNTKPAISSKAQQLIELALNSFRAGETTVAYSAILGAMNELK